MEVDYGFAMKEIPLSNSVLKVRVDDEDFDRVSPINWNLHKKNGWVGGWVPWLKRNVSIHRFIMRFPTGRDVDHWDSDKLNNQKSNLRIATDAQNGWNARKLSPAKSKYKGVFPLVRKAGWRTTWQATIGRGNGETEYLGSFPTEIEAARAYDFAALQRYGEFAKINFPTDPRALAVP